MPRRYGADGTRLWNGKTPEEFTEADTYRFMAETEAVLQRKELMDDPAQPAPASGKEEFYLSKKDDVLLTQEQIAAEERRWLFDAPIAELAEVKGVSIDEAVKCGQMLSCRRRLFRSRYLSARLSRREN